jgi:hypothetical protein
MPPSTVSFIHAVVVFIRREVTQALLLGTQAKAW